MAKGTSGPGEANDSVQEAIPAPVEAVESLVAPEAPRRPAPRAAAQVVEMESPGEALDDDATLRALYQEHGLDPETGERVEAKPPAAEDEDADDGEDEAEAESPDDGEDESPDGEQEQAAPDWAAVLVSEPHRINEVPAKERGPLLQRMLADRERIVQEAYTQALAEQLAAQRQQWQAEQSVRQAVAEIDQLREDPEAFVEWQTQFPDRAAVYFDFKRREAVGAPPPGMPDPVLMERKAEANDILASLTPEIRQQIEQRAGQDPARYDGRSRQGLMNLRADVAALQKEAQKPKAAKKGEARAANAEALRNVPKPDFKGGTPAAGGLTLDKLKAMTPEQIVQHESTAEGRAEIERLLTSAR